MKKWLLLLALSFLATSATYDPKLFHRNALAQHRPAPRRPHQVGGGRREPAERLLHRRRATAASGRPTDYGRTWNPIFDDQPTGSIGAIAVAPSDPNVIYVGSGEGLQRPDLSAGDGVYKSTDAGKTWTHLGLRDGQQIPQIAVDPRNPDRLFVAVLGHPYGPNAERGIYRSTDGGQTFEKVLCKDENTGAARRRRSIPTNPDIVYAALWEARQGPWENGAWTGTGGGIFKSTDGGTTWQPLTNGTRPTASSRPTSRSSPSNHEAPLRLGRDGAAASRIYRSDDAGETLGARHHDPRPAGRIGGGDLSVPAVDPKNPDIVYVASTVTWKSTDGGKTWTGFRGAPGGDDYQRIWINPNDPQTSSSSSATRARSSPSTAARPGAPGTTSRPRRCTTSTPTTRFPYRVCSGQQESGSACVSSRGNDGADHVPRVAAGRRRGVRLRRARSARPRHRLRRQGHALRPAHRAGRRTSRPKPVRAADYRVLRTAPVVFSPGRSARAVLRRQHALDDRATAAGAGSRSAPTSRARPGRYPPASASIATSRPRSRRSAA